jgi:hypothetical protein
LVELEDYRWVLGRVEFYSDFPSPPSVFLQDASWIERETGKRHHVDGPGLLISGEIKSISFYPASELPESGDGGNGAEGSQGVSMTGKHVLTLGRLVIMPVLFILFAVTDHYGV